MFTNKRPVRAAKPQGLAGILRNLLTKEGVATLHGEVRWGYADDRGYVHGVMVSNLSEQQREALVGFLTEFAFAQKPGSLSNWDPQAS